MSINVPDDKAKAVIDAMEREMMDKLATKADLENLRLATKADVGALRSEMGSEFKLVRQEIASGLGLLSKDMEVFTTEFGHRMERLESRLTVRLGSITLALTCALFAMLKLTA